MKYYRYVVCRASGRLEKLRVPALWDPYEVARKLRHGEVFLEVPEKSTVWDDTTHRSIPGPAWVWVDWRHEAQHYVPRKPETEADVMRFIAPFLAQEVNA